VAVIYRTPYTAYVPASKLPEPFQAIWIALIALVDPIYVPKHWYSVVFEITLALNRLCGPA